MITAARAAAMLQAHASSATCSCAAAVPKPCHCMRSLQASRAKATMEEACVDVDADVFIRPAPAAAVKPPGQRRPAFHLAPASGWINDPNGPLLHNGTYHLFYQHVPDSSEWQWGLVWGHAKSEDLVNWEHLPVALEPTPNGLDQHGCFSGCATVDVDGRPSILYTGVIRKTPEECEPGISPQHEAQIIAVATDLDDPYLQHWQKLPGSFLPHPPADMDLTGWRDPFVLEKPTAASPWWYVMIGAGVRNKCGTALVYRSKDLTEGWQYVGPLCDSPDSSMWECPIMAHLSSTPPSRQLRAPQQQQQQQRQRHLFSVSPDYCVNMIQYWLGDYAEGKFDLPGADGPFRLDLGDIMYAPNVLTDKHGRTVLWAWMQEKQHMRPPGAYNSACCLCVPRALYLSPDGKHLMQEPLPELRELRQQQGAWHIGASGISSSNGHKSAGVALVPGQPLRLGSDSESFTSSSVDVELTVSKGESNAFALVLHPFEGTGAAAGAAVAYCWSTNTLQVLYTTDLATVERMAAVPIAPRTYYKQGGPDPVQLAEMEAAAAEPGVPMRCGGTLRAPPAGASSASPATPSDVISLRILLDGSCLEVFTSTGEALGTRVYRGDETPLQKTAHVSTAQHSMQAAFRPSSPTDVAMAAAAADGAVGWEQLFNSSSSSKGAIMEGGQLALVSFGEGPAMLLSGSAWQMSSMWQKQQQQQQQHVDLTPALPVPAATAVTAAAAEVLQGLMVAEAAAVAAAATAVPVILPVGELSLDVANMAAGASAAELLPLSPSGAGGVIPVQVEAA